MKAVRTQDFSPYNSARRTLALVDILEVLIEFTIYIPNPGTQHDEIC